MGLDALPTDNLYQFLAMAGILLVAISVLGPWRQVERMMVKNYQMAIALARIDAEVKYAKGLMDVIQKQDPSGRSTEDVETVQRIARTQARAFAEAQARQKVAESMVKRFETTLNFA